MAFDFVGRASNLGAITIKNGARDAILVNKLVDGVPQYRYCDSTARPASRRRRVEVEPVNGNVRINLPLARPVPVPVPVEAPVTVEVREKLWVDEYAPSTLDDLYGLSSQIGKLLKTFQDRPWKTKATRRAYVFTGTSGTGKSITAKLIAAKFGMKLTEFNPLDMSSEYSMASQIFDQCGAAILTQVVLLENIDTFQSQHITTAWLAKLIRMSPVPIIIISDDVYNNNILKKLDAKLYEEILFEGPPWSSISSLFGGIMRKEGKYVDGCLEIIRGYYESFMHDVRRTINGMQIGLLGLEVAGRDWEHKLPQSMYTIIDTLFIDYRPPAEIIELMRQHRIILPHWIFENYLSYVDPSALDVSATFMYNASSADVMSGDAADLQLAAVSTRSIKAAPGAYRAKNAPKSFSAASRVMHYRKRLRELPIADFQMDWSTTAQTLLASPNPTALAETFKAYGLTKRDWEWYTSETSNAHFKECTVRRVDKPAAIYPPAEIVRLYGLSGGAMPEPHQVKNPMLAGRMSLRIGMRSVRPVDKCPFGCDDSPGTLTWIIYSCGFDIVKCSRSSHRAAFKWMKCIEYFEAYQLYLKSATSREPPKIARSALKNMY